MPEPFQLDPDSIAALERAVQATEENTIYEALFGPPKSTPLSDEDRATYEALYGPGTGGDTA